MAIEIPTTRAQDMTQPRRVSIKNNASSDCPPYNCLQITDITVLTASGGGIQYQCKQPDGTAGAQFLFNMEAQVAKSGGTGSGTFDFPCQAIWDTGTPVAGDMWGPKAGQWALTKGGSPGFPFLGIVDASKKKMMIGANPGSGMIVISGVLAGTLTPGSSCSCNVNVKNGVSVSGLTVTVQDLDVKWFGDATTANKFQAYSIDGGTNWYFIWVACG